MGRKARFTNEDFLEAALALLADKGPGGVTIAAIADKIGAPVGSVYHRFASREILLAELWVELIESFQAGFLEELNKGDGQKAALHTLKWVKKHPNQARVFLLYRREELIAGDWPGSIKDRVANLISELDAGLTGFTRHFLGKASKKNLDRVALCLIQIPASAVRAYLEAGKPVPGYYEQFIRETYMSLLGDHRTTISD